MRKTLIPLALASSLTLLAACSETAETPASEATAAAAPADADAEPTNPAATAAVIDANSATEQQLAGIAGVTPEIAKAIVAGRPYADATALAAALEKATTKQAAAELMKRVFVPVNLNTASEEAIKLIPGMTPKMVHEFLEYRPYEDMAEFDREIGKYVDEAEVARLRSYVTL